VLFAIIEDANVVTTVSLKLMNELANPPPRCPAVLKAIVLLIISAIGIISETAILLIPPPIVPALFFEIVLLTICKLPPEFKIAPPAESALLNANALLVISRLP